MIARADELDAGTRAAIEAAITGSRPVRTVEVGVQGRAVVLLITVPSPDGRSADLTRVPLELDEARDLVNGRGRGHLLASK